MLIVIPKVQIAVLHALEEESRMIYCRLAYNTDHGGGEIHSTVIQKCGLY